jgi:hypothetical protein
MVEHVPLAQAQQGEPDCKDYNSQAEAQADLRANPSDPFGLDGPPGEASAGRPGVACEDYPYPPGSPRDETPVSLQPAAGNTTVASQPPMSSPATTPPSPNTTPPPAPPFNAGGPRYGPVPLMPSGNCPPAFSVKQDNACYEPRVATR